jgi:uncharacterized protein
MPDSMPPVTPFTPTARTRLRRRPERARYDRDTVFAILDAALFCHIGYVVDGQPFVTPTLFWREGERLYWHGSAASRMLRAQKTGIPVCLTVTHIDGLVLARSGFHHSLDYRSVMVLGAAEFVEDEEEKRRGFEAFIERLYPGRNAELRPITAQELKATALMRMAIAEVSAKLRTGGPIDDEADYALPCWAGVIPIALTVGAAIPDARLGPGIASGPSLAAYAEGKPLGDVLSALAKG